MGRHRVRKRWVSLMKRQQLGIMLAMMWGGTNLLLLSFSGYGFLKARDRMEQRVQQQAQSLRSYLQDVMQFAVGSMERLRVSIEQADGDARTLYAILLTEVDTAPPVVRFAWSGRDRKLRVTSVHGIYPNPPDISNRDYIRHAQQHPYEVYVTPILTHVLSGREFLGVSMGFTDAGGKYLGNLLATISIATLKESIERQMAQCDCDFQVFAPRGEVIVRHGALSQFAQRATQDQAVSAFRVVAVPDAGQVRLLLNHSIMTLSAWLLLVNGLLYVGWRWLHRRWIGPVALALRELSPMVGGRVHSLPLPRTMQRIGEVMHGLQDRLAMQEAQLAHTRFMLDALNHQQQQLLRSSSDELSQTYRAIHDFATYLEERMSAQAKDPDAPYLFDDVREMGMNLQFLSSAFLRVCEIRSGQTQLHRSEVNPAVLLEGVVQQLADAMERRNLQLEIDNRQAGEVLADAHLLSLILWALMYLAVRHAEDESTIAIRLTRSTRGLDITLSLSRYRATMLPSYQRDFSHFIRSLSFHEMSAMLALMRGHVNALMLESFLALCAGELSIEPEGTHGIGLQLVMGHDPQLHLAED